jgi:hypothetical protein
MNQQPSTLSNLWDGLKGLTTAATDAIKNVGKPFIATNTTIAAPVQGDVAAPAPAQGDVAAPVPAQDTVPAEPVVIKGGKRSKAKGTIRGILLYPNPYYKGKTNKVKSRRNRKPTRFTKKSRK